MGTAASGRVPGDAGSLLDSRAHLALAKQLQEGGGEGQVHQAVVLQSLGQEHAQEVEELGHLRRMSLNILERKLDLAVISS